MKRRNYIILVIILVGLAASASFFLFPRQLPIGECSEEYRRYRDVEGIDVSFVKELPINDSVSVDVTLFQARDSAIWADLIVDLYQENRDEYNPVKLKLKMIPKNKQQSVSNEITDNNLIAASLADLTVGIFYIETEQQYNAIMDRYFNNLNKKQSK